MYYITALQEQMDEQLKTENELKENIDLCITRLARAGRLSSALGDQKIIWAENVEVIIN